MSKFTEESLVASPMKRYAFQFWKACLEKGYFIFSDHQSQEQALANVVEKTGISYGTAQNWFNDFTRMCQGQGLKEAQK